MDSVVKVTNLTKKFGKTTAVDNISCEVRKGEIVGLLGPNGAGKTTTIHMLLGLTKPTSGEIKIFGKDLATNRQQIAKEVNFVWTYMSLHGRLTVWENLYVFSHLYEVANKKEKINEILSVLEMEDLRNKKFQSLSSGQQARVLVAKSLINDPKLLFLDEPTAALDPEVSRKVQNFLLRVRGQWGTTMFYTSHDMAEVTRMCDRVIFLYKGRIVAADTPHNLTKKIEKCTLKLSYDTDKEIVRQYLKSHKFQYAFPRENRVHIDTQEEQIAGILRGLSEAKVWITEIDVEKPNLEDVFLEIAKGRF